jgi:hypothetical protein
VKLDQTYESLDILSLKIFQKDIYRLFDSDYGVIVGRVLGTGVGIPNCRISVFVPIDENEEIIPTTLDDIKKIEALALYPYQTVYDKDSSGKVYNLLPKYSKNRNVNGFPDNEFGIGATPITPVGTFPEKEEILVNETVAYVYDKYLRYTTVTNESGDYILTVPSNRNYDVTMCCDITDIGKFSTTAALLKLEGFPDNYFNETGTLINEDIPLERLPNIDIQNLPIYVNPLWSQNQENTNVGINRIDFNITKKIRPFSTVIGNYFTQSKSSWWGDRIVFRALIGLRSLCVPLIGDCVALNTDNFISFYYSFSIRLRLRALGVTIIDDDIVKAFSNTQYQRAEPNWFKFCLGFKVKYIIPFFNFLFNQRRYCTLRGGKVNSEPFDFRFELADACTRGEALKILGGEITDKLFLEKHERGDIDIKVMSIKNTVPDAICDTLNKVDVKDTTISTQYDTDSDIELYQENKYVKYINNGNFVVLIPPNRKKVIINEEGDLIEVDKDSDIGVFTQFRGYFLLSHKGETDNPPTADVTAKIKLKIPQEFDYNNNPITWIWKHFTFDFGEIYSVAQYNEVRFADFNQNNESDDDDMLKPGKTIGWDEQTNILFTGGFNTDNNNVTYNRDNNTDIQYTSFYNHVTYLGIDGDLKSINNDGDGYGYDSATVVPQPPLNRPSGIILYRYGESNILPENQISGWNMFDNNPYNGNTPTVINFRINLVLPADYNIPTANDLWSFGIRASSESQIQRMEFNGPPFNGPDKNYLFNVDNLAPTYQFISGTDGAIFKFFDITIPQQYLHYFYIFHKLMVDDNASDYQQWVLETVLSNGYDNTSYNNVIIGTINRSSGLERYINKPY